MMSPIDIKNFLSKITKKIKEFNFIVELPKLYHIFISFAIAQTGKSL